MADLRRLWEDNPPNEPDPGVGHDGEEDDTPDPGSADGNGQ